MVVAEIVFSFGAPVGQAVLGIPRDKLFQKSLVARLVKINSVAKFSELG